MNDKEIRVIRWPVLESLESLKIPREVDIEFKDQKRTSLVPRNPIEERNPVSLLILHPRVYFWSHLLLSINKEPLKRWFTSSLFWSQGRTWKNSFSYIQNTLSSLFSFHNLPKGVSRSLENQLSFGSCPLFFKNEENDFLPGIYDIKNDICNNNSLKNN
jgi:hypothetical protein